MVATASPQAEMLAPGTRVGRYEIVRRLAVGGMAEIHLARATGIEGFEKLVVLKRILPQFAVRPEFVAMFLDEARLSAALEHPNVAQVYDIGEIGGSYFFTMEYIRGQDVRSLLASAVERRARVPLEHALTIIMAAAAGLHAAHELRGPDGAPLDIVHRDVSPSNVLVSYEGAVKLVDFGVAKAARRRTETRTGTLKGKAAYMSPEQCTAGDVDRRSDVFALGILLYELTTCRRLFQGDTEFAIMSQIVHEDAEPPSRIVASYPRDLERIVLRALSRDRGARYQSAQELQIELEELTRRHRIRASIVGLAGYMREAFAERIREQPPEVTPTSHSVGAAASGDELEVEIEVEEEPLGDPGIHGTRRRRRPLAWAAALALLAGGAGAAALGVPSLAPLRAPPAAQVAAPSPSPPPPATMTDGPAPVREHASSPADSDEAPTREFAAPAADVTAWARPAPTASPEEVPADDSAPAEVAPEGAAAGARDEPRAAPERTRAVRPRPRRPPPSPRKPAREEAPPQENWDLDAPLPPPEDT